jgi:hypothetical protein
MKEYDMYRDRSIHVLNDMYVECNCIYPCKNGSIFEYKNEESEEKQCTR